MQHIDPSAEELLGWDLEVANTAGLGLLHPSDRLAFGAMLKFLRSEPDGDASLEVRFISDISAEHDGSTSDRAWIPATVTAVNELHDPDVSGLVVTATLHASAPAEPTGSVSNASPAPTTGATGPFDQDNTDPTTRYDASEPTDIGIRLRPGSSVIDVATGPVQGKLGCHPDSLAGLHLWELLHGDDEVEFTEALDLMEAEIEGEFVHYGPMRFVTSDGAERIFDTTIIRKPSGLIVRARDLGEPVDGAVDPDQSDTAIVFLDENYNVTYASASFDDLMGRPATSAVGMELLAAVHPSDRCYVEQRLRMPGLDGQIHGFLRVPVRALADTETAVGAQWQWIEVIGRNYLDDPTVAQVALQLTAVDDAPTVTDALPDEVAAAKRLGTFTRDEQGNVSFINDVLLEMLGSVDAVDFASERSNLVNVGDGGGSETIEIDTGNGDTRFLRSRLSPIIGADGERTGDVALVEDITSLVESGDLPDHVGDGSEGSVVVVERSAGIKYLSADLAELTGADLQTELHDFFTPKSAVMIRSDVWPALVDKGMWSGQLWLRSVEGSAVPYRAQFYNESDLNAGEPLASIILTPLESVPDHEHEDQLAVDALTLLSSGAGLKRRAVRAIAKTVGNRARVAVALIEIDGIEDVVPTGDQTFELSPNGHDELAIAIADRLALACRHDEAAARIDQHTFAVLSEQLGDAVDLEHLTSRLVDELSPTFVIKVNGANDTSDTERFLNVRFNLGLAHGGEGSISADELFANADIALHRARNRGRIRTATVGEHGQLEVSERRSVEDDFRVALSSDELSSQLDNLYQAVLPSSSAKAVARGDAHGSVRRFEALVRWNCPSRGLVGAREVVELANELGMASAVGHRVLDRSLDFIASTQRHHGVTVQVDVNLSPSQAIERGFASRLDAMLRLYEVDPEQLGIELAESSIIAASAELSAALEQLRDIGVRLVVDNVTGRLFRSELTCEGVSELKINRRLIEGVGRHAADTAHVAGILARSAERDLEITAVGVATGRQLDLLADLGCSWFQGFLLGRPKPATDHDFSERELGMVEPVDSDDQHGVA